MAILLTKYKRCNGGNEMELKINRKINKIELKMVEKYLYEIGLENGYIQKLSKCEEIYVPDFK